MEGLTGFAIFTLCHHFGRRARAMARSLALQVQFEVPICLTVFHQNAKDRDAIEQGLSTQSRRLGVRFIEIRGEAIMQRAVHFSDAHRMHTFSHTVFMDADLWFPPNFWMCYASAIASRPAGYWSCSIMDIPLSRAEALADQWEQITHETIRSFSVSRRHDSYQGRVGTFQCIPRALTNYPTSSIMGVGGTDLTFSEVAVAHSADSTSERRIGEVPCPPLRNSFPRIGEKYRR